MSFFGRSELGDTDDPTELVPGSVAALEETANGLRKLSNACQEAYAGVSKLDVGHWTGEAAEKFGSYFAKETPKWRDAAEAFGPAVEALTTYKGVVERAQREAAEAIRLYNEAKAETKAAEKQYEAAASQHEKDSLAAAASGDTAPGPLAPFSDPGQAKREMAERILADARKSVREAAAQTAAVINKAKDRAPQEPGFLSKVGATLGDAFDKSVDQLTSLHKGAMGSALDLVKLAWAACPMHPYNVAHPGEWAARTVQQAAGMVHMATHPVEAMKSILNVDEWKKDPFAAFGRLAGDVAVGAVTGGSGTAGKLVAREVAETAAREAVEQAGTKIARHVDDGLPPWHRADYEPPSHTPDYTNPHPDEPFGPQKTDPDDHLPHDRDPEPQREPDPPAEEPKREPDEQPRIREPEQLPEPDKSQYFRLQDLVREIDSRLPDLPPWEKQAQQEMMNSYRQQMRDIMAKHS